MRIIAHRGNTDGPNPTNENKPSYIEDAINKGFDAEVDVRVVDGQFYLGHDTPQYPVTLEWMFNFSRSLWFHCKDQTSLGYILDRNFNAFYHTTEAYVLTSRKHVWHYPGAVLVPSDKSILVMPESMMPHETIHENLVGYYGVCTDYAERVRGCLGK